MLSPRHLPLVVALLAGCTGGEDATVETETPLHDAGAGVQPAPPVRLDGAPPLDEDAAPSSAMDFGDARVDASSATSDVVVRLIDASLRQLDGASLTPDSGVPITPPPQGWMTAQVGSGAPGTHTLTGARIDLRGAGAGLPEARGAAPDGFHFVYTTLAGDGEITVKVLSADPVTFADAWAGVTMRESLSPTAPHASAGFQFRCCGHSPRVFVARVQAGMGSQKGSRAFGLKGVPLFVRLTRTGNLFRGTWSVDGKSWREGTEPAATATIEMKREILIGFLVAPGNAAAPASGAALEIITMSR